MDETFVERLTMAGVYIHIPFCKSRCKYCDFFSTTQLAQREDYVNALIHETLLRVPTDTSLSTIYFGGGTPSLLEVEQIEQILEVLLSKTPTRPTEITLEANPGDLTLEKLISLRQAGINRLSIGIQSLNDEELKQIGRRHTAQQAKQAIHDAQQAGFDNISIDLMYALPNQTIMSWQNTINKALALAIQHISCYCLSYEEGTALTHLVEKGKLIPTNEDTENEMYDILCATLAAHDYIHYEVSNFAKKNKIAQHNSSYWNDTPYIGLGAGAHSYDGVCRRWNNGNLKSYMEGVKYNTQYWELEALTPEQKAMEHIMLGLRTSHGIRLTDKLRSQAEPMLKQGLLNIKEDRIIATQRGLHILNRIIEQLI